MGTNLTLYTKYWLPFGEVLTDMERRGIKIDTNYLKRIQLEAERDKMVYQDNFMKWMYENQPNADEFNPNSNQQLAQLLFGPCNKKGKLPPEGTDMATYEWDFPSERLFRVENTMGYIREGKTEPLKMRDMKIKGLGIPPVSFTTGGLPQADTPVIKTLAGKNPTKGQYGVAYDHYKKLGEEQKGIEISLALDNWAKFKSIETLLNTYICPLQGSADENSRIHCSMNLNTETGRLSARKPNLQNQPAGDKDIYKIRKAFVAKENCKLIVADYGQLELRIMAHMTDCKAMIKAFELGGDFHSRTALGMYPEIK